MGRNDLADPDERVALKRVIEPLQQFKANLLVVVLNDVKVSHSRYYYYRGYEYRRKYGRGYQYSYTTQSTTELVAETAGAGSNGHHPTVSKLKALINDPNKKN